MSNQLPVLIEDVRQSINDQRDSHLVWQAESTAFDAQVVAETLAAIDVAETTALADVIRTAIDEEVAILQWGTSLAKGSGAAAQLVAEKVTLFSELNSRRIRQRFGN